MTSRGLLLGLSLGVLTGLFLGEYASVFEVAADGYVKLLQMTVLPLVVVSLITGIGGLDHDQIKTLGTRTGLLLILLWAIGLFITFLFPLMFPPAVTASFFSTTLIEPPQPFDFVDLYIPSNPFRSLAENIVPAVVLFSIVLGIALVRVPRRERLLDVLDVLRQTLSRATTYVVALTPFGLFAIAATIAGTLRPEQIDRLEVYLVSYVAMSLLVTLWWLPGLVALMTPIPYRTLLHATRNAMITAFMTSSLFVVLPMLTDHARELTSRYGLPPEYQRTPDVIVPASFNFPHIGKVLTLSFILFAGWFADAPVSSEAYPHLAATGVVVLFGSVNVAVPFLLDLFRIPADTFQLFLATGVVNSRFGTLMAAMHTMTMALIGTWLLAGTVRVGARRLVRYLTLSAVLTALTIVGVRLVVSNLVDTRYKGDVLLAGMTLKGEHGPAVVLSNAPPTDAGAAGTSALARARGRGTLRVGFLPDSLPFSFTNTAGNLVGFDAELAHVLADELQVGLEFVPVSRDGLAESLRQGVCDIVMSGVVVTADRASATVFSTPYLDETLAFVVPDHSRERFASWERIKAEGRVRIGVPGRAQYVDLLRIRLPEAEFVAFNSAEEMFPPREPVDALLLTAERGSAWTLLHPEFSIVVPMPGRIQVPLAYPVADLEMARFVDTWIDLVRKDGTIQELYDYWILGRTARDGAPRWSIVRNVLHWVD